MQSFEELKKEVSAKRNDFTELGDKTMIIEAFLHECQAGNFGEEGEKRMVEAAVDLVTASVVTSVTSFYTMIHTLTYNQDILRHIHTEIDDVVGSRTITLKDMSALPYLRAVIYENFRFQSIVPIIPRETTTDIHLSGYTITKGTEVLFNAWAAHHDKKDWPDPFTFNPQRFLTDDGALVSPDHINRKLLLSFGHGTRTCPGKGSP